MNRNNFYYIQTAKVVIWYLSTEMQFFQRDFAVTSVIKIYSEMWELWIQTMIMHLLLTSK